MGKPVTAEEIRGAVLHFGDRATLVTVDDDGRPHVTTSLVEVDADHLIVGLGPRTKTNVAQRSTVTLVWQPPDGEEYLLILDGSVVRVDPADSAGVSRATVVVDRGIQHRLAGLEPGPSTCRLVDADV